MSRSLGGRNTARDWLRVGVCPVCGTWVLVDDDFVRVELTPLHAECARHLGTDGAL